MERDNVTDTEIEQLLSGSATADGELAALAEVFTALRVTDNLDQDAVARYVAAATGALPVARQEPAPVSRPLLTGLRRRAAAVAMSAGVFIAGTSGLAVAADDAKPGDVLYGIDRAFEAVGIGAGAEQERLSEAEQLVEAGKIQQGLQHTAEVLDSDTSDDARASEAVRGAAERVETTGAESAASTRESVAGLLTYISENVGQIDGNEVAELAVEIGGPDSSPQDSGPPGRPDDLPSDPPGLTDREPGPPDHVPGNPPGLSNDKPGNPKNDK